MIPIPSRSHLAAFYRGSIYNSTDQTPQVQAFQLLRYHRNPLAHGLEHAVPPGPADPSTVPPAPLTAAAGGRAAGGHSGAAELRAVADRGTVHALLLRLIGELRCLAIQFLFVYPRC